jgi:hypothetical protein
MRATGKHHPEEFVLDFMLIQRSVRFGKLDHRIGQEARTTLGVQTGGPVSPDGVQ